MKKADQGVEEPKKKKQTEEDLLYEVPDNLKVRSHETQSCCLWVRFADLRSLNLISMIGE